jgi:lysophospholipid acyltransferase (LPLAT)-like uncharacterized protein
MAGVPVTAFAYAISHRRRLPTWDGFVWPLPFGRGVFYAGDSFQPPAKPSADELSAACARLAGLLDAASAAAEAALAEGQGASR